MKWSSLKSANHPYSALGAARRQYYRHVLPMPGLKQKLPECVHLNLPRSSLETEKGNQRSRKDKKRRLVPVEDSQNGHRVGSGNSKLGSGCSHCRALCVERCFRNDRKHILNQRRLYYNVPVNVFNLKLTFRIGHIPHSQQFHHF